MDVMKELSALSIRKPVSVEPQDWYIDADPNEDIDTENGQCICGDYNCSEEYAHWTSGY